MTENNFIIILPNITPKSKINFDYFVITIIGTDETLSPLTHFLSEIFPIVFFRVHNNKVDLCDWDD